MTTPATGTITSANVTAEIDGGTTSQLNFLDSCPRELAARASGSVGLFDFRGKSITPLAPLATSYFVSDVGSSANCFLQIQFLTNGNMTISRGGPNAGTTTNSGTFRLCAQAASNFQVQFTNIFTLGTTVSVSNGASTYQTINATRTLLFSMGSPGGEGSATGSFTVNVRRANNASVIRSVGVSFEFSAVDFGFGPPGGFF